MLMVYTRAGEYLQLGRHATLRDVPERVGVKH